MAAEHRIAASSTIAAPHDKVWELFCDTGRYAEWVEGTLEVVRTDGPARLGVTYDERTRIAGRWKTSTHWRVSEFEPPRRRVHEGTGVSAGRGLGIELDCLSKGDSTQVTPLAIAVVARTWFQSVQPET